MRLLNTRTGEFIWVTNPAGLKYAILSHVWATEGEQSFQDLLNIQEYVRLERETTPTLPINAVLQRASPKIRESCAYALADGFDFIWIDSCCIDKTSSAELSEAINSMYLWYRLSTICYAFLEDVDGKEDPHLSNSQFRSSRWYTRGWTLQELIAPTTLIFLSSGWLSLGTKRVLAKAIEEITGIDEAVLTHEVPLSVIPVARRMSWASKRVTTRKEDEAYSLMGIFNVNMPAIYGEGVLAFLRLQEEILKQVPDQTIFVWDKNAESYSLDATEAHDETNRTLLASSPAAFAHSGGVKAITWDDLVHGKLHANHPPPSYIPTSHGLRTAFPLLSISPFLRLAILACADEEGRLLALVLRKMPDADVHSVGTHGWERIRARYRPLLRTLPSGVVRPSTGHAPLPRTPGDTDTEVLTRVVRLIIYPRLIPTSNIYVAHRPLLIALTREAPYRELLADQAQHDDPFPAVGGRQTGSRVCMSLLVDSGVFLLATTVLIIVFLALFLLMFSLFRGFTSH